MSEYDSVLLDRISRGWIHVDSDNLDVHYYHSTRKRFYRKVPNQHPISGRWRFMFNGRYTVYRNRLVYLYFKRTTIPHGWVVDHVDVDLTNDHPSNLRLMTAEESHKQGYVTQEEASLAGWLALLEYIHFVGEEPRRGSRLWDPYPFAYRNKDEANTR